jgi:hypothetical protein
MPNYCQVSSRILSIQVRFFTSFCSLGCHIYFYELVVGYFISQSRPLDQRDGEMAHCVRGRNEIICGGFTVSHSKTVKCAFELSHFSVRLNLAISL